MPDERRFSRAPFSRLYPILDASLETEETLAEGIQALARAGCRLVQLRAKELSGRDLCRWSSLARAASRETGTSFLVDDRVDVALLVGADGVHLGQDDLSPKAARKLLGSAAILGLSTHDLDQARRAESEPVDYVAIGPIFETRSKSAADRPVGIERLREVRAIVRKPLVAIGGITLANAPALLETGVDGLAVISALKGERDLEFAARTWLAL